MKILNFGSLNIDYTYCLDHIVAPGETISSRELNVFPGGKGLNQSIALARAGAEVYHAGSIGSDGMFLKELCAESGADTRYIREVQVRTGNAIIQVASSGQNCIILYPGANRCQTEEHIGQVLKDFGEGDMILLQNEINLVGHLIHAAHEKGMTVVLNPSPFDENLMNCEFDKVDIFLMNEVEGEQLTGKKEAEEILNEMKARYPHAGTVLTMGEQGSVYSGPQGRFAQSAILTKAVDTTAAGDTFTGYYLAAVLEGKTQEAALLLAARASALAVSRHGAASSIPCRKELDGVE